jgi:hypothetical protein
MQISILYFLLLIILHANTQIVSLDGQMPIINQGRWKRERETFLYYITIRLNKRKK